MIQYRNKQEAKLKTLVGSTTIFLVEIISSIKEDQHQQQELHFLSLLTLLKELQAPSKGQQQGERGST